MEVLLPRMPKVEEEPEIAGAFYRPAKEKGEPDTYNLIVTSELDTIMDEEDDDIRPMHVIAPSEERIMTILSKRYPAPPGGTFLYRVDDLELKIKTAAEQHYSRRRYRDPKTLKIDGWMVLKKPFFEDVADVDEIMRLNSKHGPVFVTESRYKRLFTNFSTEAAGFVVRRKDDFDLVSVNYNPGAHARREYNQALAKYESRMSGDMPKEQRLDLYRLLHPGEWPNSHPFNKHVQGADLYHIRGWGHRVDNEFSLKDIDEVLQLTLKLYGEPFWRNSGQRYGLNSFDYTLNKALQYLHGMEAKAKRDLDYRKQKFHKDYIGETVRYNRWHAQMKKVQIIQGDITVCIPRLGLNYRETSEQYHAEIRAAAVARGMTEDEQDELYEFLRWSADHEPKAIHLEKSQELYVRDELKACDEQAVLRLCRWLRREAKVMKIPIPRPPVAPTRPGKKRKE